MKQIEYLINNKKTFYLLALFILFFYFLPYFIYGKHIFLVQYDNLDSNIIWYKILAENHMGFTASDTIIPNMMNGLPRIAYPGELSLLYLFYNLFEPLTAYIINDILIHTVAFFSMFILIEKYIFQKITSKWKYLYIFIPSIAFALVPFWPHGGLSVAGQPLALYAFLNIRKGDTSLKNWLILLLLPFYSSLILSFIFFLFAMGILWIYDFITEKKINYFFLSALIVMGSLYLLVEYRLVYSILIEHSFLSHRTEFNLRQIFTFDHFYKSAHTRFLNGTDNNIPLHYRYILPFILTTMLLLPFRKKLGNRESIFLYITIVLLYLFSGWHWLLASKYSLPMLLLFSLVIYLVSTKKLLPFLMIIQILLAYWADFWQSPWWNQFLDYFPLIKTFHFSRFIFVTVTIWYLMFALSIYEFIKKVKFSYLWIIALLLFQIHLAFTWKLFSHTGDHRKKAYDTYYATALFDKIAHYIGKDKHSYRIVSLGLEPAVSLYNGFYTIDGYSTNYPLKYKHRFRSIMSDYLNKLPPHIGDRKVYDDWGSKVYLLQPGCISRSPDSNRTRDAKNLFINTQQLYCMGVKYIFSAYEIKNAEILDLEKLKTFKDTSKSIWTITLYRIKDNKFTSDTCKQLTPFKKNKKIIKTIQDIKE
ncbi:DUF6044 family protein [Sulfurovum sp. ST-21]|uniref:Uncharacterized protein n=1 Tax=Sulfurovum indicum TaxID=2779528 RepID=A0A7M1S5D5_9BACT|nr:DUF6044 family protein [Sulfurovum indicum]QOR62201.1 hypothetical protein IMZ28_01615 [Sulfurovum indicum]